MITIHLIPAGYGDTILLQILPEKKGGAATNILIDSGFKFKKNILPRLTTLKTSGMDHLDLFVVTHYDSDHIASARNLIKTNGNFKAPNFIPIYQIWLNTFRHLQDEKRSEKAPETDQKLEEFINDLPKLPEADAVHEIGAEQASLLGREILTNGYPWNADFGNQAACVENGPEVTINDVKLTLLSPSKQQLKKLESEFIEVLKKHGIEVTDTELIDDALELYFQQGGKLEDLVQTHEIAAMPEISTESIHRLSKGQDYVADTASANGSSIAFVVESQGKRILMLADAHSEQIMSELENLYKDKTQYPIFFDAVKVAHHGSYRNNRRELFQIIDSPKFLFSTNGMHQSHKHPDLQTIACIIDRPLSHGMTERKLIFNYELEHLKGLNDELLKTTFHYQIEVCTEIELS